MTLPRPDSGSFKEEGSRVFTGPGGIFRALDHERAEQWQALSAKQFFQDALHAGHIVGTTTAPPGPEADALRNDWSLVLRHERIPAISYPYEWTFSMLRDAAVLQLELLLQALDEGFIYQDATPFNIQFIGTRPVFIDVTSLVPYQPGETWQGYRQFCSMYLFPLMLEAYRGTRFQPLLRGELDGIDTTWMRRMLRPLDALRPGVLKHVVLHDMLTRAAQGGSSNLRKDISKQNAFGVELVRANARKLLKLVRGLSRRDTVSEWSDYSEEESYGGKEEFAKKQETVRRWVRELRPKRAWDIGCNRGIFSRIIAQEAELVVSMDGDQEVIDLLYRDLKSEDAANILPLVQRFHDPSPALGWRNAERPTLAQRTPPDLVAMLAVVHHLAITANIPLTEILDHLHTLGCAVIIEFVDREDQMVQLLMRNKDKRHDDYTKGNFENQLGLRFDVREKVELKSGARTMYFAVPKS